MLVEAQRRGGIGLRVHVDAQEPQKK
jgi:hypothetical protein